MHHVTKEPKKKVSKIVSAPFTYFYTPFRAKNDDFTDQKKKKEIRTIVHREHIGFTGLPSTTDSLALHKRREAKPLPRRYYETHAAAKRHLYAVQGVHSLYLRGRNSHTIYPT